MIGSDFEPKVYAKKVRCSECHAVIPIGSEALVSEKNGKVKKIVCSEDCRQEFDANFWAAAARANNRKRRKQVATC